MSKPRIEEVDDDDDDVEDPEEMDLDAFDFARPQKGALQPAMDPTESQMNPEDMQAMLQPRNQQQQQQMSDKERERLQREQRDRTKNFQCIYPIYFDASRSRDNGRRVKKEDAVPNPLAREIVEALQSIASELNVAGQMQIAFEPSKTHPKDWANPGRVRVLIKEDGRAVMKKIQNSKWSSRLWDNIGRPC